MESTCLDCSSPVTSGARCEECRIEVLESPPLGAAGLRLAGCGHFVPRHRGRQRVRCAACTEDQSPAERRTRQGLCGQCGEAFTTVSAVRKFCTIRCGEIARGQRLPDALPGQTCAVAECSVTFQPKRPLQRCCSEKHGKLLYNRESRADGRQKSNCGDPAKRRARLRIKTQMRRARTKTDQAEKVDRDVVGDRDRWKCGICRRKIDRALPYPHPRSPSLDHIVPLSQNGPHTFANCRITHLVCNTARSNRGGNEQLALVG